MSGGYEVDQVSREELLARARRVLDGNYTGEFTKPSLGQYPHQWNWDSAFIAIGLRHVDAKRARQEVRTLLKGQWRSGMVPHILYHEGTSNYFPTPEFWRLDDEAVPLGIATSGLTQPPLLATAVRLLIESETDDAEGMSFAAEVYPKLLAWHRWLHTSRDPDGSGLVAIIHPWEAGTDNSPRFSESLAALGDVSPPAYARADLSLVDEGERPLGYDYDRFMHLIGVYREMRWDDQAIGEKAPFMVQDVFFNSILYRANDDLRELGRRLGEDTAEIEGWLEAGTRGFRERLWNEQDGLFYDFDLRAGRQLQEATAMTLSPLFAGVADEREAGRLVRDNLLQPKHYWPGHSSRFLLPSTAKSSQHFEPRRYWRGPVWLSLNWLILRGLERYGQREAAGALRSHSLELAARTGFVEYYDPRDGTACGAPGFSWSAALVLDLLLDEEDDEA